jgi:CCR4-NOT transcriptional complex subunit CAF120
LKNVLSLSSAGKNRYLLHFNSFHSLTQWTAAIRLSMFEHTSLYEAYTGSLIAAKGKHLNGINSILAPTKFKYEDWARVRFGAGTPWRRCWFVINPPDEKELQKARKVTKKSAYDRLSIPVTGNIRFYETKKTKKAIPIATVTQVFSAHAIYPQSKALIDTSTLVKMEGRITTHSPESSSEGIVFIMPEPHAAVSGFEMMLRFLFPTFDTFNLYGRPTRLVADVNHIKSIMFAFPKERRYGYLDVLDICSLLQTPGSLEWTEAQWRKQLKEATQRRISSGRSRTNSVSSARPRYRSMSGRNSDIPVDPSRRPFPAIDTKPFSNSTEAVIHEVPKDGPPVVYHNRGISDTTGFNSGPRFGNGALVESSPDSSSQDLVHRGAPTVGPITESTDSESDPSLENLRGPPVEEQLPPRTPPAPVANPPEFSHGPREMPVNRPEASSEQRLANNRMSHGTLSQLTSVGTMGLSAAAAGAAWKSHQQQAANSQQPQERSADNIYHPGRPAFTNALAHSSSDEGIAFALPVRPPPVPEHRPNTPSTTGSPASQPISHRNSPQRPSPQQMGIDAQKSVRRKPLPQRDLFGSQGGQDEPSYDDLRHTLDEDVLNSIAPHVSSLPSPISPTRNDDESVYDNASTVSPDYASTHESVHSKKSTASTKPRMGVMKTVGVPAAKDLVIGDAHYTTDKPPTSNPDIPSVDFGPTMTYMPTTGRPNTSDTLKNLQRKDSAGTKLSIPTHQMDQANARPSSREEYRRSVLWQPGMASGRPVTPGGGLTPEQYVQQRAAPSPPIHGHSRTPSNPMTAQRPASGDWTQYARPNSPMNAQRDPHYRPSSRGAQSMLNHNDHSTQLSAREQEHVARMTGSSFFNMSNDNRKPQAQVNPMGLVSAIDAREREKREMREGMSNQMVQQAIAQRQQSLNYQQPMMHQQQWAPQQFSPQQMMPQQAGSVYPGSVYPPQHGRQASMYNMPMANHTWDALNQPARPDEPRRSSWYGQLSQAPQTPPSYQQSQVHAPDSRYYNYAQ